MNNDAAVAAAAAAAKSSVEVALEALKPIRDIVKNWDIDISSCLEEFLRDLVGDKHAKDVMQIDRQQRLHDGDDEQQQQQQQQGFAGSFSFTNAALVLDSSSRVYSRKVEYLHQLVFKALDSLAASFDNDKQNKNKNKRARAAASPEILEFQAFDPMEEFLLLDDVLPTDEAGGCRHINLPSEVQKNMKKDGNNTRRSSLTGPWNNVEITRRREAGGGGSSSHQSLLKSPSLTGLSLVNRTAPNNYNSSFANVNRSSVLGSAALQTLVGSAASGTTGAHSSLRLMRMHGCTIDAAGALVMPGSHKYMSTTASERQEQQQNQQNTANASNNNSTLSSPVLSTGNNNKTDGVAQNRMDIVGGLDDDDDDDGAGFAMTDDDHDDDDGGRGYAMVDNNEDIAAMPPQPSTRKKGVTFCDDLPSHKRGAGGGGGGDQNALLPSAHAAAKDEEEKAQEEEDPWKLLDPHVAATEKKHQPRPLVVGMTLQLPRGVTELPSEAIAARAARNNNSTQEDANKPRKKLVVPRIKEKQNKNDYNSRTWALDTFRANLKRAQRHRQQQQQPSSSLEQLEDVDDDDIDQPPFIPLTGLFYGTEFEYIAHATAKRKAAERREMLQRREREPSQQQQGQQLQSRSRQEPNGNVQPQSSAAEMMLNGNNNADEDNGDDEGGFGMGDHDDGDDNEEDDVGFVGTGFDEDNDTDNNNNDYSGKPKEIVTNTGLTFVDQAYQTTALDDDNDSNMNDRHFAALCRARIESFAKGAEKYASDTNLSKRVEKWQSKVKPMLENEERRPGFDIHVYSQRILMSMEQDLEHQRAAKDDENMNENEDDTTAIHAKGNSLVDFATVTQDCEQYDVCRIFLAALSLCNAGNINVQQQQIDSSSNKPRVPSDHRPRLGTLRLELLKRDISQPMDTYLDFGK